MRVNLDPYSAHYTGPKPLGDMYDTLNTRMEINLAFILFDSGSSIQFMYYILVPIPKPVGRCRSVVFL